MFSESNIVNRMFYSILQYSISLTSNCSLSAFLKGINNGEEVKSVKTTFYKSPPEIKPVVFVLIFLTSRDL